MEKYFNVCDTWSMSEGTIGWFIRRNRRRVRMTQQELADALQMTNRSVTEWEAGRRTPGRDALTKLASIFRISLDEFQRYIRFDDPPEDLSVDQVKQKQQAIQIIDELLADPQKLDQWIEYGSWLRSRGSDENQ